MTHVCPALNAVKAPRGAEPHDHQQPRVLFKDRSFCELKSITGIGSINTFKNAAAEREELMKTAATDCAEHPCDAQGCAPAAPSTHEDQVSISSHYRGYKSVCTDFPLCDTPMAGWGWDAGGCFCLGPWFSLGVCSGVQVPTQPCSSPSLPSTWPFFLGRFRQSNICFPPLSVIITRSSCPHTEGHKSATTAYQ